MSLETTLAVIIIVIVHILGMDLSVNLVSFNFTAFHQSGRKVMFSVVSGTLLTGVGVSRVIPAH